MQPNWILRVRKSSFCEHTKRRLHHSSVASLMMRCSKPCQPYHNIGPFTLWIFVRQTRCWISMQIVYFIGFKSKDKQNRKSANICQSYKRIISLIFFMTHCTLWLENSLNVGLSAGYSSDTHLKHNYINNKRNAQWTVNCVTL